MLKRNPFIIPSAPVLRREPPTGPQWLHEVKFDGWRAQLHKTGEEVAIFTRNGHDYTGRFPAIRDSLLALPTRSAIIDAEIVVCDSDGKPNFKALMKNAAGDLCAWCFDLLELRSLGAVREAVRSMRGSSCTLVASWPCASGGGDQRLGWEIVIALPPLGKVAHPNVTPINSNSLIPLILRC